VSYEETKVMKYSRPYNTANDKLKEEYTNDAIYR
jgi:hypothetical protein